MCDAPVLAGPGSDRPDGRDGRHPLPGGNPVAAVREPGESGVEGNQVSPRGVEGNQVSPGGGGASAAATDRASASGLSLELC